MSTSKSLSLKTVGKKNIWQVEYKWMLDKFGIFSSLSELFSYWHIMEKHRDPAGACYSKEVVAECKSFCHLCSFMNNY